MNAFWEMLDPLDAGGNAREAVDARLTAALQSARNKWEGVELLDALFFRCLASRIVGDDISASLTSLHTDDLYLTAACAEGSPSAIAAFDRAFSNEIVVAVRRLRGPEDAIFEVKQALWQKWFVRSPVTASASEARGAPQIGTYSGRGDLRSWVRVSAVHATMRFLRPAAKTIGLDDLVTQRISDTKGDIELEFLRKSYLPAFDAAVREAIAALSSRDRNLLRYYFVKNLSLEAIGVLYGVHLATVARWLKGVRESLAEGIKSAMLRDAPLTREELESIIRIIQSQFELDLPESISSEG